MFRNTFDEVKISGVNSRFAKIQNQNFSINQSVDKKQRQWQESFLKSSRSKYSHNNQQDQSNQQSFQQEEHSVTDESTFSFNEYKEILNNLFQNGEHELQWSKVPEIVKLIIKAMSLSINTVEKKVMQNREVINDQGLRIKENQLSIDNLSKAMKKTQQKFLNQSSLRYKSQEQISQMAKYGQSEKPLKRQQQQFDFYAKGLDLIMIEEVKTITDAIVTQKMSDILGEMEVIETRMEQRMIKQLEIYDKEISALKSSLRQVQCQQKNQSYKFQHGLKQRINIIEAQTGHLMKQLQDEKQAMCELGHYVEERFMTKQQVNDIIKATLQSKPNRSVVDSYATNSSIMNRNKIEQIVKYEIESYGIIKKKDYQEFKEKVMKNITSFATINEVEKIVNKAVKGQHHKSQHDHDQRMLLIQDTEQDEDTLELKKIKSFYKNENSMREKSPIAKKTKSKLSKKGSEKQLKSTKVSANKAKSKTIYRSNNQTIQSSPFLQGKSSKLKSLASSEIKDTKYEDFYEQAEMMMKKLQKKMKEIKTLAKQTARDQLNEEIKKLEKKLLKRIETAEQQFCSVVEDNWKTMSENNLKIQKSQKQNMERLLQVVSVLNVIARYSTILNCQQNECIKWEKQVFNATGRALSLSGDKQTIYVTIPGVYLVHVVVYTLYDPVVDYRLEVNGEEVCRRNQKVGVRMQREEGEDSTVEKKEIKANRSKSMVSHPSRGVEFTGTLLIPAKSNLTIRLLKELNGQALIEIRKM